MNRIFARERRKIENGEKGRVTVWWRPPATSSFLSNMSASLSWKPSPRPWAPRLCTCPILGRARGATRPKRYTTKPGKMYLSRLRFSCIDSAAPVARRFGLQSGRRVTVSDRKSAAGVPYLREFPASSRPNRLHSSYMAPHGAAPIRPVFRDREPLKSAPHPDGSKSAFALLTLLCKRSSPHVLRPRPPEYARDDARRR